jgi:hypothetical protein
MSDVVLVRLILLALLEIHRLYKHSLSDEAVTEVAFYAFYASAPSQQPVGRWHHLNRCSSCRRITK